MKEKKKEKRQKENKTDLRKNLEKKEIALMVEAMEAMEVIHSPTFSHNLLAM